MKIRREKAGSDSYGHVWEHDGDTADVLPERAAALLAIPDGGFSVVEDSQAPAAPAAKAAAK